MHSYYSLLEPTEPGACIVPHFYTQTELQEIQSELADSARVTWRDSHERYVNNRGKIIDQNHDTFALKLSAGDQRPLQRLPYVRRAIGAIASQVQEMSVAIASLRGWTPDEVSVHRYDKPTGLSEHKDNKRFVGLIGILSIVGTCDLTVNHRGTMHTYKPKPGDLMLLRAPGLIKSDEDLRPEHAVVNLAEGSTRTSLMVRANDKPHERITGFTFSNW